MPRRKRVVIPGIPHHVTQRGGRRQNVFFERADRQYYLQLLKENAQRYGVEILAYCLMTNHVHHLLIPLQADSLRWTLQLTHKRYADYINARQGWSGHLWQQRFYSSAVDEHFFWITLRYIERNPVEAGLVQRASSYEWSSAAAHCRLRQDPLLNSDGRWSRLIEERREWEGWLEGRDPVSALSTLRKNTSRDLPTGTDAFLDSLEQKHGVVVRAPKLGRPLRKKEKS